MSKGSSGQEEARREELLRTRAWEVKESPIDLGYKVVPNWLQLPEGWVLGDAAGVAADSENRVYVFHRGAGGLFKRGRGAPPLLCFDSHGTLLSSWSETTFGRPHMVKCDVEDNVWLIDDGAHVIYKFSPQGELLFTLGTKDVPGEDGTHFNQPTDIAFGPQGEMYVSDGYGNKRIAKLDAEGGFLLQWGSEGQDPGQFALPHGLTLDSSGLVYVADRENWRVQVFDPDGEFITQWTHIGRPFEVVYVLDGFIWVCDGSEGWVTKVSLSGEVIGFLHAPGEGPGQLSHAHDIAFSPNTDIIVGQLDGRVQKFSRH